MWYSGNGLIGKVGNEVKENMYILDQMFLWRVSSGKDHPNTDLPWLKIGLQPNIPVLSWKYHKSKCI